MVKAKASTAVAGIEGVNSRRKGRFGAYLERIVVGRAG